MVLTLGLPDLMTFIDSLFFAYVLLFSKCLTFYGESPNRKVGQQERKSGTLSTYRISILFGQIYL